jgi:acyl dehydratase
MPIDPNRLESLRRRDVAFPWKSEQSLLYAVSVGFGRDPGRRTELDYLDRGVAQRTVPTMATVMTFNVFEQDYGWDYGGVLHGEQRLKLYRPLTPSAELIADFTIEGVSDRGAGKPAVLYTRVDARQASDNAPMFSTSSTLIARADGGFGGRRAAGPVPHQIPDRKADMTHRAETRPEQAMLYRLNGDYNPLHASLSAARRAGFDRPILHGLCTYGFACKAILETVCEYDHTLIREFDARFTAPVYPGDVIVTDMWQSGEHVAFRCRVPERDAVVLDHGHCVLAV